MAIALEFLNLIIPIHLIAEKYSGGWAQCLADHDDLLGQTVWHDDHLLRDGAMNSSDMQSLVNSWKSKGFTPQTRIGGKLHWLDMCVVAELAERPTLPCKWLDFTAAGGAVFLKGKEPGIVVGRKPI